MKSHLTRAQAVAAANKSLLTNDTIAKSTNNWGEAFVAQCEAIGIKFATPADIEKEAFEFIHTMSSVWMSAAAVAQDMKSAGYTIVRSKPEET